MSMLHNPETPGGFQILRYRVLGMGCAGTFENLQMVAIPYGIWRQGGTEVIPGSFVRGGYVFDANGPI